jgi:hypothetical protein
MSERILFSLATPHVPADEPALLDWYRGVHIPQVLAAVPALEEATLYRSLTPENQSHWWLPQRVLTTYRISADASVESVTDGLTVAATAGRFDFSAALDGRSVAQGIFERC